MSSPKWFVKNPPKVRRISAHVACQFRLTARRYGRALKGKPPPSSLGFGTHWLGGALLSAFLQWQRG